MGRRKFRNITVDNELYFYKVGTMVVDIRTYERKLFARPTLSELMNRTWADLEDHCAVTPSIIENFIRNKTSAKT